MSRTKTFVLASDVPEIRLRAGNDRPVRTAGDYVLYWMHSFRRSRANFALQRAIDWAKALGKPLLVWEPIGCRGKWNSDRTHAFALQGMADQQEAFARAGIAYYPWAEPAPGVSRELFAHLVQRAAVVVTDDFPCYFIPQMLQAAGQQCDCLLELVDANGLFPLRGTDQVFVTAYSFRRFLQKSLLPHLQQPPRLEPCRNLALPSLSSEMLARMDERWPAATHELLQGTPAALAVLPIDHRVSPAVMPGGARAGHKVLREFVQRRLARYEDERNQLDDSAASGLSPYLHFGQIGAHEVFHAIVHHEQWIPEKASAKTDGKKTGWWNMSPAAESFLDELVTWREIGFNLCSHRSDYDRYESLPEWAQQTLAEHASDPRPMIYTPEQLARAETHDELWNAAQRQLVRDGEMHNYLRMLWGKKVLEWSPTPQTAFETLIDLNNRYAVDGRNPNSYAGISWIFGRYDRPWGPIRPIFGTIRYMSSDNTARKMSVKNYLQEFGPARNLFSR